jgi:hypothetical protein
MDTEALRAACLAPPAAEDSYDLVVASLIRARRAALG